MKMLTSKEDIIDDLKDICGKSDCIVLRGYIPITELYESKDIDILVSKEQVKDITKALSARGWTKVKPNCFRYPHIMFRKTYDNGRIVTIDVVNDLFFGNELFHQNGARIALNTKRATNGIFVAAPENALIIFMLHVIYDKRVLSEANKRRMVSFIEMCENGDTPPDKLINNVFYHEYVLPAAKMMSMSNDDGVIMQQFKLVQSGVEKNCILQYNAVRRVFRLLVRYLNIVIRKVTRLK